VHRKRPELWPNDWIFHHDSDPAYRVLPVKQFLAQKSITGMKHPPYFPDFVPNDLWLFPEMRFALKGRKFKNIEELQEI
jgi:hypothetical protein